MRPPRKFVYLSSLFFGLLLPSIGVGQNAPSSQPSSAPTSSPQNTNPYPYGNSQFPHGNTNNTNPYNTTTTPNPYNNNSNPYGGNSNPYGNAKTTNGANPYGSSTATPGSSYGASAANAPSNQPNPALTADTSDRPSAAPKLLYAGAGLFGVGGLVAAGLAINFKSKAKDATNLPAGQAPNQAQVAQAQDLIKSTRTMAVIADSSLALALGCAAGGFLLGRDAALQASISANGASLAVSFTR